jgi:hypothetical protein
MLKEKEEIVEWLNKMSISNYELIEDEEYGYKVNVEEDVDISKKDLDYIAIKFGFIRGNFYCNNNKLEDLEGCPEIVKGSFWCYDNKIKSLKYFPKDVGFNINISSNKIKELKNIQKNVKGYFDCSNNEISYLKGRPKKVDGTFYFDGNNLKEIKIEEESINNLFVIDDNILDVLDDKMIRKIRRKEFHEILTIRYGNRILGNTKELENLIRIRSLNNKIEKKLLIKKEKLNKM